MSVEPGISAERRRQLFYDTIADDFDAIMDDYDVDRRLAVVFDELLADVDLSGKKVLDAGCGTGRFSERACLRGGEVTSVDIGSRLLSKVRSRCDAEVACSDITRLALPSETFDIVVSSECIEHTPSPQAAVAELLRVCKPGGRVVITCPNKVWRWSCTLADWLKIRPYDGLENWPSRRGLRRWIEEAGGEIVSTKGIHLFPFVIRELQPLLRRLEIFGRSLGAVCVNQAVLAVKRHGV